MRVPLLERQLSANANSGRVGSLRVNRKAHKSNFSHLWYGHDSVGFLTFCDGKTEKERSESKPFWRIRAAERGMNILCIMS